MIYKKKRIKAQTKNFGNGEFGIIIHIDPIENEPYYSHYCHLISTFWAFVTTEDLKVGWSARFFQSVINCRELHVQEGKVYNIGGKDCSFKSMPAVWQQLFEPVLDAVLDGKWDEFDLATYNAKIREEMRLKVKAMSPDEYQKWLSKVNPKEV